MAGRKITVEFLGKDTSAGKTAAGVETKMSRLGGRLDKVGQAAGKMLAGGVLAGGAAMVKFGGQAADLAETQSKVNAIFGAEGAAALDKFAGSAAKNLGQSKQTALDAAATFGTFGKAAGKSGMDLANFSSEMTVLASDLASFNNTSPEEAVEALGAALRGEAEPMRAYGVMLDDATLKAEAMSLGLLKPTKDKAAIVAATVAIADGQRKLNEAVKEHGKDSLEARKAEAAVGTTRARLKKLTEGSIGTLTNQQKVMAAQSAIMKQTKDAQGDFAKTSGGLANKQRILKAELTNVSTELGAKALPAMLKAVNIGMKMIAWADKNRTTVAALVIGLGGLAAVMYTVSLTMRAWTAITKVWSAVTKVAAAVQWALNAAMAMNPIGLVIIAIIALVAAMVIAYKKSETFRKIVDKAFRAVQTAASFAFNWIKRNWPYILGILTGPVGLAVVMIIKHWDKIKAGLQRAFEFIKRIASSGWNSVRDGAMKVIGLVRDIPGRIRDLAGRFKDAGVHLIQNFVNGLSNAGQFVSNIVGSVLSAVRGAINAALGKIESAISFKIDWPGPGSYSFNPSIPRLARGGIVPATPGGRLVRVAEGGHAEAIVPLSGPHAPRGSGGGGSPIIVQLKVGAKVLEQILVEYTNDQGRPLQVRTLGPA